jgi:hypothetical protein
VLRWLEAHAARMFLPTIVLAEINEGISALVDGRRRRSLEGSTTA